MGRFSLLPDDYLFANNVEKVIDVLDIPVYKDFQPGGQ